MYYQIHYVFLRRERKAEIRRAGGPRRLFHLPRRRNPEQDRALSLGVSFYTPGGPEAGHAGRRRAALASLDSARAALILGRQQGRRPERKRTETMTNPRTMIEAATYTAEIARRASQGPA